LSRLGELSKPFLGKALGISFYRYKEVTQLYIWGCSYALMWTVEKCLSPVEAWSAARPQVLIPVVARPAPPSCSRAL
jgi:hypothetical protein